MAGKSNGHHTNKRILLKLKPAFDVLVEAFEYADDTESDHWEFAVAIERFYELGLSETDLRWLVRKNYVEHAREVTKLEENGRVFRATGDLSFCNQTCFVLTSNGAKIARFDAVPPNEALTKVVASETPRFNRDVKLTTRCGMVPCWDVERRELRLNDKIVKKFKWCAANQESILDAFEEEHWTAHIDDPLPPHPEQDSKRRLSDTIKCLNRKQLHPLIHFRGDGTGEGVIWELVEPESPGGNNGRKTISE